MAGNPPVEHRFKPGQSGNISGRPRCLLTVDKLRKIIDEVAHTPVGDLCKLMDGGGETARAAVAAIFHRAVMTGEHAGLNMLLDRALGKVPEMIEQHVTDHTAELVTVPRETLHDFVKKLA